MAFVQALPIQNRTGTLATAARAVPAGLSRYAIRMDTDGTFEATAGSTVTFIVDFSFDGGTTWPYSNQTTFVSGSPPVRAWQMGGSLPQSPTYPSHIRGRYTVTGVAARFGVSVDVA